MVIPAARTGVAARPNAHHPQPQPQRQVAVLDAEPVPARPVVIERSDDTWKRNVLFFIALLILLILLAFLAQAFINVLSDDGDEGLPSDTTALDANTVELPSYINFDSDQAVSGQYLPPIDPVVFNARHGSEAMAVFELRPASHGGKFQQLNK